LYIGIISPDDGAEALEQFTIEVHDFAGSDIPGGTGEASWSFEVTDARATMGVSAQFAGGKYLRRPRERSSLTPRDAGVSVKQPPPPRLRLYV
jgi:hypothetical protein